jgi:hypothetical protein
LANVRSFERYRRSFYLNITTGRGTESEVRRRGGVFGVGLGGFTGLGGGFAGLGGGGGAGFTGGGGIPDAGGFLGLLQDQLQIRNLEENIARLAENVLILENTLIELLTTIPDDPEAIIRQRLQVAQARSALLSSQTQLVGRQANYQSSLDSFLRRLGLPPYLCLRIEDPILDSFELIDSDLRSRRQELIDVRTAVGRINVVLLEKAEFAMDPETGLPEPRLTWTPEITESVRQILDAIQPMVEFNQKILEEDLPRVADDINVLEETIKQRRQQNRTLLSLYRRERENICTLLGVSEIDESVFEINDLDSLAKQLRAEYDKLNQQFEAYRERLDELRRVARRYVTSGPGSDSPQEIALRLREDVIIASQDLLNDLADDVLSLQLVQANARIESVMLPEVDIEPAEALEIARRNRRDWANARASLVDTWRLIEFNADDLESSLDIVFSGDVQNVGDNPFKLRGQTGRLRAGIQWDAPITRLQERNTYRQSLIEFEQAKREYYSFEDAVWQLLRAEIRQLQANRLNFELGRQSVRIAAEQLELNEDIREFRDARGLSSGPTAARDTISALSDLLNSQNALLNIFVNFEVVRRGLHFDMGTMELTPEGLWIDPGVLSPETLMALGDTTWGMIDGGCTECCLPLERLPLESAADYPPRRTRSAEPAEPAGPDVSESSDDSSMPERLVPAEAESVPKPPAEALLPPVMDRSPARTPPAEDSGG